MQDAIDALVREARETLGRAGSARELEEARVRFLGKKGSLTRLFQRLGEVPPADKPRVGAALNRAKEEIGRLLEERSGSLGGGEGAPARFDPTLPGRRPPLGRIHPLTRVQEDICRIFREMGFERAEGPDVETDRTNFLALNFPPDHPARDTQDTFYLWDDLLLRTHTSPVQIRVMEGNAPPFRFVAPGRVYRHEAVDATHHHLFHQVEGFLVDEGVTFAHLKGVLDAFGKRFFGTSARTRFRPSFFPFTEPSAEMDVSCIFCGGEGCRICKQSGWVEMMGCGMIHPAVLENCGVDPERWTGFAFGMGVERIAMFRYRIDDIRLFYQNDLRFLRQF